MRLYNVSVAHHRNGVSANSFSVVTFDCDYDGRRSFVATVFEERGNIAVLDRDLLAAGEIRFGENSWRGDDFEPAVREEIAKWELRETIRQMVKDWERLTPRQQDAALEQAQKVAAPPVA